MGEISVQLNFWKQGLPWNRIRKQNLGTIMYVWSCVLMYMCVSMCICVCMYVYVCVIYDTCVCMHVCRFGCWCRMHKQNSRQDISFPALLSILFAWGKDSHYSWIWAGDSKPQWSACLHPVECCGYSYVWLHLAFHAVAGDSVSGSHLCPAATLTHWTIPASSLVWH